MEPEKFEVRVEYRDGAVGTFPNVVRTSSNDHGYVIIQQTKLYIIPWDTIKQVSEDL